MGWGTRHSKQECPRCGGEIDVDIETCPYCGRVLAEPARSSEEVHALLARKKALGKQLSGHLAHMPLLSIPWPLHWEYHPLGLVTSQSVTGTGVFSDITSMVTDVLGLQSGMFRDKLRAGEDLCKHSLRMDAMEMGGHAVIGIDVDYAEVGNTKMLMVCMTGTAVRLQNLDPLGAVVSEHLTKASTLFAEMSNIRV